MMKSYDPWNNPDTGQGAAKSRSQRYADLRWRLAELVGMLAIHFALTWSK